MRNEVDMADRGRDLKIGVIAATDKFDLDDPARQLENLADAAKDAGRDTERGLKVAEGAFEDLGNEGNQTARDLSKYLDKIKDDARKTGKGVDAGLDEGKQGLRDFKDESRATARESAASFSGSFDDVADTIQETMANALGGFGPLGAAAGIALASGFGFFLTAINDGKQRVAELTQSFLDLRKDGIDPATDAASHMVDELDAGKLREFKDDADKLGLSYETLRDALDGNADSIKIVRDRMSEYNEQNQLVTAKGTLLLDHFAGLNGALDETQESYTSATAAAQLLDIAGAKAAENLAATFSNVADGSGVMASAIEEIATRQAAATKSTEDAWTDYKDTALASIDDVIAKQLEQLAAAQNFETNTKVVLDRLGQDAVDWALSQGENADKAMQLLATAPLAKGKEVVANYRKLGQESTSSYAASVLANAPVTNAAASRIRAEMQDRMNTGVTVPVGVTPPSAAAVAAAASSVQRMMNARSLRWRTETADVRIP